MHAPLYHAVDPQVQLDVASNDSGGERMFLRILQWAAHCAPSKKIRLNSTNSLTYWCNLIANLP